MNCRRSEELFSDHTERTLAPPLERELTAHLETCAACAELYAAFQEVVGALGAWKIPAPPEALSRQLALASANSGNSGEFGPTPPSREKTPPRVSPRLALSSSWLAAAAIITLALLWRPPEIFSELTRKTSRAARQTYSFGVRTYHQGERWVEDLNVLRITVGVAFEDRLDRINEQLRDLDLTGRESDENEEQSRENHPVRESPMRQRASIVPPEHFSRSPL